MATLHLFSQYARLLQHQHPRPQLQPNRKRAPDAHPNQRWVHGIDADAIKQAQIAYQGLVALDLGRRSSSQLQFIIGTMQSRTVRQHILPQGAAQDQDVRKGQRPQGPKAKSDICLIHPTDVPTENCAVFTRSTRYRG